MRDRQGKPAARPAQLHALRHVPDASAHDNSNCDSNYPVVDPQGVRKVAASKVVCMGPTGHHRWVVIEAVAQSGQQRGTVVRAFLNMDHEAGLLGEANAELLLARGCLCDVQYQYSDLGSGLRKTSYDVRYPLTGKTNFGQALQESCPIRPQHEPPPPSLHRMPHFSIYAYGLNRDRQASWAQATSDMISTAFQESKLEAS